MAESSDPYRNFRFRVEIQGIQVAAFSNATIPDESEAPIEYREGVDPFMRSLTLTRGVTRSLDLQNWWAEISHQGSGAPGARKNISIVLVDDGGNDSARWDLFNAWPSKYEAGEPGIIETLEIGVESIKRAQ